MVYKEKIQVHRALMAYGKEYHDFVMFAVKLAQVHPIHRDLDDHGVRARILCETILDSRKNPKAVALRLLKAEYEPKRINQALQALGSTFENSTRYKVVHRHVFDSMIIEVMKQLDRHNFRTLTQLEAGARAQIEIKDFEQYAKYDCLYCVLKDDPDSRSTNELNALLEILNKEVLTLDQSSYESTLNFALETLKLYREFGAEHLHNIIERMPQGHLKSMWITILCSTEVTTIKDALFHKAVIEASNGSISVDHFDATMVSVALAYQVSQGNLDEGAVKTYSILLKEVGL